MGAEDGAGSTRTLEEISRGCRGLGYRQCQVSTVLVITRHRFPLAKLPAKGHSLLEKWGRGVSSWILVG